MEIHTPLHFSSKKDEVKYWMDMAKQMHQRKEEIERELQEYQESSLSLERELESSFEQSIKKNKDLSQQNFKLSKDYEHLKNRLNEQIKENSTLQIQMQEVKKCNEHLALCVRKLEQANDDLERTNRQTKVSEEDLEAKFNIVLEKIALLETEIDEKEGLKIAVQRLKDENKDLQQQIQVKERQQNDHKATNNACGLCRFNSIRLKTCRHGASKKRKSMDEQPQDNCNTLQNSSLVNYVRELEDNIVNLEKCQSPSTDWTMPSLSPLVNKSFDYSSSVEGFVLLEQPFRKQEQRRMEAHQEIRMNSPGEPELRVCSTPPGQTMNQLLPHSAKLIDDRRTSTPNPRPSRFEVRLKKVRDEEKRQQSLAGFLKRLRYDWIRKKN